MDCIIYLVRYQGQTESPYTWYTRSFDSAERLMASLQEEWPERKWDIVEKDVS